MIFGGFQPLTLLDFPGQVACIAFAQGCNLRCGYCHNPQLVNPPSKEDTRLSTNDDVLAFLETRRDTLDGVVISGGEPTLQPDLIDFLARVKALGLRAKLDTNGTNPSVLDQALGQGLLDYVAMDVKHDPARYSEITGVAVTPTLLHTSRDTIRDSGIAYEFRTTVLPQFHNEAAFESIARFCEGASRFVLQCFSPEKILNPAFRRYKPPTLEEICRLRQIAERFVNKVEIVGLEGGGPKAYVN
jgi:pyruvate formate lyase activating enzyme